MPRKQKPVEPNTNTAELKADPPDESKETVWLRFWNANEDARKITTDIGRVRSGMGPKRTAEAQALLKEHGF